MRKGCRICKACVANTNNIIPYKTEISSLTDNRRAQATVVGFSVPPNTKSDSRDDSQLGVSTPSKPLQWPLARLHPMVAAGQDFTSATFPAPCSSWVAQGAQQKAKCRRLLAMRKYKDNVILLKQIHKTVLEIYRAWLLRALLRRATASTISALPTVAIVSRKLTVRYSSDINGEPAAFTEQHPMTTNLVEYFIFNTQVHLVESTDGCCSPSNVDKFILTEINMPTLGTFQVQSSVGRC
jgi:hypothetical protein